MIKKKKKAKGGKHLAKKTGVASVKKTTSADRKPAAPIKKTAAHEKKAAASDKRLSKADRQPADTANKAPAPAPNETKKMSRKKKILLIVSIALLALILASVCIVTAIMGKINRAQDTTVIPPAEETFDVDPEPTETAALDPNEIKWDDIEDIDGDHVYNILLIGQDRRENEGRCRSDSMILISVNTETEQVHMISLMRDLYVQIPGYSDNRLNVPYVYGGMPLLDETIKKNFGVTINGNVEVDFESYTKAIDIVGGVDVELTGDEAGVVNNECGGHLTEGMNHLTGEEALSFARIRKLDSDFGRTERQRKVLTAMIQEIKKASLTEVLRLINEVLPLVTTDLSNKEIIKYASLILPMLQNGKEVITGRVPQDDAYTNEYVREMAVLVPDLEKCRDYLEQELYGK